MEFEVTGKTKIIMFLLLVVTFVEKAKKIVFRVLTVSTIFDNISYVDYSKV